MSKSIEANCEVGWGKPPKHSRYKKGQSGYWGARKPKEPTSIPRMIEDEFGRRIVVQKNGTPTRMPVFEAILLQLATKAAGGSRRATNVLKQYVAYVASTQRSGEIQIVFLEEPAAEQPASRKSLRDV